MCLGPLGYHNDSIFNLREEPPRIAFCQGSHIGHDEIRPVPPLQLDRGDARIVLRNNNLFFPSLGIRLLVRCVLG